MATQVSSDARSMRPQLSDILPMPEPRFKGSIGTSYTDSKADVDIGCDTCSPVSDQYETPFAFTGTLHRVLVDTSEATFEDLAAHHEQLARYAMATQ